ncbi:MAG TPA: ATP-binding cassette domain-containing protein, partial [Verrucomicrobiota bacterium]|nr:ATP-binding cassette domain-containing protein [Verrucomicrobiota bacterium]
AAPVSTLGIGQKQLVEIVKALRRDSRILILDEPTAALSGSEVDVLLRILAELRARGVGLIYISHKLDEVKRVADRITVLRDGATITTLAAARADVTEIIRAMVGREIQDLFPRDRSRVPGETLLEVKGLSVRPPAGQTTRLRDISFTVRAGEVVGLGGLMGAGRSETLMHLVGAFGTRTAGTVTLAGAPLPPAPTPRAALDRGLVLVTEDRKRYGLVLGQDIGFNLSLSSLRRFTRGLLLDDAAERAENARHFTRLHVRAPGLDAVVGGLSGGNQQKVVLGKALMLAPKVMLLDE